MPECLSGLAGRGNKRAKGRQGKAGVGHRAAGARVSRAGRVTQAADLSSSEGRTIEWSLFHARERSRVKAGITVPNGKVKFFDAEKGFGFLVSEDGQSVYVHASTLPEGVQQLRKGQRVEFDMVDGSRGPQALTVRLLDPAPSIARARRVKPEDMAVMVEDLIQLLDGASNGLRHGRYPDRGHAQKVAAVLRAVADSFEA